MKGMVAFTTSIVAFYVATFQFCVCVASRPTGHICDQQELAPEPAVFDSPETASSHLPDSAEPLGSPPASLAVLFDVTQCVAIAYRETNSSLVCYPQDLEFF